MFGKKREPLFGKHIDAKCEYCKNSKENDGDDICRFGYSPQTDGSCLHFTYDPLKRSPKAFPPLHPHDADEFKL